MGREIDAGIFSGGFDDEFGVGPEAGNTALFGRDVLHGLVDGIDEFVEARQPRWTRFRSVGPALLGSAMWIDDEALIRKLDQLSAVCIVVRKELRNHRALARLRAADARLPSLPTQAFPELIELAPKVDGSPRLVGPSSSMGDERVSAIRSIGYRARKDSYGPIVHAKLALLGHLWWHDEGEFGVEDVLGFEPKRLWISSANFTRASRGSLEFGFWTEDEALMRGAERFLIRLIASSEPIDAESDLLDPEFVPVQYDDEAMAAAMAEYDWEDE